MRTQKGIEKERAAMAKTAAKLGTLADRQTNSKIKIASLEGAKQPLCVDPIVWASKTSRTAKRQLLKQTKRRLSSQLQDDKAAATERQISELLKRVAAHEQLHLANNGITSSPTEQRLCNKGQLPSRSFVLDSEIDQFCIIFGQVSSTMTGIAHFLTYTLGSVQS
jgi:hypothetical protein